jgi:hypothetical protein
MGMHPTTTTTDHEQDSPEPVDASAPVTRHVRADLALGLTLLGLVIAGKLLWAVSDGSFLAAIGTR